MPAAIKITQVILKAMLTALLTTNPYQVVIHLTHYLVEYKVSNKEESEEIPPE
jgi:hypothetical protein